MIDIKKLTIDELHELNTAINKEIVNRQEERFSELARHAANALNELKEEFPYVELNFALDDEEYFEVNLFDSFNHFSEHDFCMG